MAQAGDVGGAVARPDATVTSGRVAGPDATVSSGAEAWRARDGVTLHARHWQAQGEPWATVLLLHGLAEHIGRYERPAALLAAAGLDVHGFDLRGHGRSGGRRVYVERWDDYLDDVEDVVAALPLSAAGDARGGDGRRADGRGGDAVRLPLVLFGHSLGALVALTYACSGRPAPDLLVLSAPPLDARIPAWMRAVAPLLGRVAPKFVISNPVDGAQLSRDPAVGATYVADPLVQPRSTARLGLELMRAMRRARGDLARLDVPTLVFHGGADTLVPAEVSAPLASVDCVERRVLPGLRHETLNEPEGAEVIAAVVAWLHEHVDVAGSNGAGSVPGAPGSGTMRR